MNDCVSARGSASVLCFDGRDAPAEDMGSNLAGGTGNSTMVDLKCVCTKKCVAAICSGVIRAMDVIEARFERADGGQGPPPQFKAFDSPPLRYFINALGFGLGVAAATSAGTFLCARLVLLCNVLAFPLVH